MTIEEMKKALMSGKSTDDLLKEFDAQLKQAYNEVATEKAKADKLDNARRRLATAIANYATELFGESDIDIAEITMMLKEFENDINNPTFSILKDFVKMDNKKNSSKKNSNNKVNKVAYSRKTESDDDILQAFFNLFK